jgi:hypothetical protein
MKPAPFPGRLPLSEHARLPAAASREDFNAKAPGRSAEGRNQSHRKGDGKKIGAKK